ncbi:MULTISPECIES: S-ribosylhomocysteine lyase [unclassified Pseudactinotalea]|uniref:S-ribosylhomocysteine lyase n=1 Tax=unclassified Pseudactinotalea TaxID=2649176 RepID=UPI00128D5267|nr:MULTISPECIES: S-ribosylhomocysteine lyase [unclassified Pseudactinotalea]MPV49960.1 S-ribosylhomocysteine lyase [Pseudactinotalea sp. HY160]QGH69221.1 S-ribosylhomocysteine lyase [Pseudactinotalea sp. HY158]
MTQPESFGLDHTAVAAPYIRVADRLTLTGGSAVTKFDLRFCQPNVDHLEMPAVHSIEHMLAGFLRDHTRGVIDISPMGCQTGFYLLMDGARTVDEIAPVLESACRDILAATAVPAANEAQCGWAASHSLEAAQAAVSRFLAARDEWGTVFAGE